LATTPAPALPQYFKAAAAESFKVRGRTYPTDQVKVPSAPAVFKLVAVDLLESAVPVVNIAAHAKNRVRLAKERGEKTWVFVLHLMIPGPPQLSLVAYFEGDYAKVGSDTPFGRVARPFFTGNDDTFRNNRFKLIPKIVDGPFVVKMAVKDTPTLLGTKLKQHYFRGSNYFECAVDVGSSSVARNIVGMTMGYAKSVVVDLGFCLQGERGEELPEVLLGAFSCVRVDTTQAKKI